MSTEACVLNGDRYVRIPDTDGESEPLILRLDQAVRSENWEELGALLQGDEIRSIKKEELFEFLQLMKNIEDGKGKELFIQTLKNERLMDLLSTEEMDQLGTFPSRIAHLEARFQSTLDFLREVDLTRLSIDRLHALKPQIFPDLDGGDILQKIEWAIRCKEQASIHDDWTKGCYIS